MYPCKDVPSVSLLISQALEDAVPLFSVLQLSLGKKLSPGSSGRCTKSRVTEPYWRSFPLSFFPENTNGFRRRRQTVQDPAATQWEWCLGKRENRFMSLSAIKEIQYCIPIS